MNSQETSDRSIAMAARILKETEGEEEAVDRLFRLAFARAPTTEETKATVDHWRQMTAVQSAIDPQPFVPPKEVVREAIDENTGKPFTFTEKLFAYEDYVPDLGPHETDPRTRGLADVCLVVMNSNEFIYVY